MVRLVSQSLGVEGLQTPETMSLAAHFSAQHTLGASPGTQAALSLASELGNSFPVLQARKMLRALEQSEMESVWELLSLSLPRCGGAWRAAAGTLCVLSARLTSADFPASEVDGSREHLQQPLYHLERCVVLWDSALGDLHAG